MKRKILLLAIISLLMVIVYGCQKGDESKETENTTETDDIVETDAVPVVTMVMEDGGEVEIELYPNTAPNTVNNFIS